MSEQRKKVLIISYYWPPSGGAGVQRWLKLSKYLVRMNVDVYVLTVDPDKSSYPVFDYSLEKDIDSRITVFKTDSFEPINWYAKLVGKKNVPTAGFSNVDNQKLSQKIVNGIRSNLFIPDPRIGWNRYAFQKAKMIIDQFDIKNVITTSPSHSTQMIGRRLKRYYGNNINWIVDFRDPWTDIYYYKLLQHSFISNYINQGYERSVIEESDSIVTVSEGFKSIFLSKSKKIESEKIEIIPNGFDEEDFLNIDKRKYKNQVYTIRYTGTMAESYQPEVFLNSLNILQNKYPDVQFIFESIGILSDNIKQKIEKLGIPFNFIPSVPHSEIVKYQASADLLLLVIPNVELGEGIVPGKVFEYIASSVPIVCISNKNSDVNTILEKTRTGRAFCRDNENELAEYLHSCIISKKKDNSRLKERYTRKKQAEDYLGLFEE